MNADIENIYFAEKQAGRIDYKNSLTIFASGYRIATNNALSISSIRHPSTWDETEIQDIRQMIHFKESPDKIIESVFMKIIKKEKP